MNDHNAVLYLQYLAAKENSIKLVLSVASWYDTYVGKCIEKKLEDPNFGRYGRMENLGFIPRLDIFDTWLPHHPGYYCHGCGVEICWHE